MAANEGNWRPLNTVLAVRCLTGNRPLGCSGSSIQFVKKSNISQSHYSLRSFAISPKWNLSEMRSIDAPTASFQSSVEQWMETISIVQ